MKAYVGTGVLGCFAFDEKGKLVDFVLFPKDPKAVEARLAEAAKNNPPPEEAKLVDKLKRRGYEDIEVASKKASGMAASRLRELAAQTGFLKPDEVNAFLFSVGAEGVKKSLRTERKEAIIVQMAGLIDDMDRHLNVYSERLREWYGLHFPEAIRKAKSNEQIARIAAQGRREDVKDEGFEGIAKISVGMEFTDDDVKSVSSFASRLLALYKERDSLERYLEGLVRAEMPNLAAVAGTLLAARLLAIGGGLEKLAVAPASRIQLLGAEKALFRHMRENSKAPKYGLIFGHELVQKAPDNRRGKVARCVASKLSLAAKTDFFSKRDDGAKLKKELEEEVRRVVEGA